MGQQHDVPGSKVAKGQLADQGNRSDSGTTDTKKRTHKFVPFGIHTFDSMGYRDYRILWSAAASTSTGHFFKTVVIGWLTYDVTGSPVLTALAFGLESLPNLVANPASGVLSDRMDKRLLMGGFSFYNSVLTIMFAALLLLYGAQAWHILTYVFLVGIGMSMEAPARTSYVTTVVPDRTLLNAFALLSVAYNVAKVIGPASAGFILALLGPGRTIFIPAALMLAAGLIVSRLKFVAPARHIESKRSVPEQILEGMVAMTGNPVVVALFLTQVVVYGIMVPATYGLLPIYAADVFLVGPAGLGLLTSACGVGAIFGVLITATLGIRLPRGKASLVVLAISAIAMIGFAGTTSFYVSIVMLGIFNAGIVSLTAIKSSGIQSLVPQNTRGRVAALTTMANGVGPIGSLAFGACAQTFDAPTATVVAAVAVFVSISCLYFKWPQLTKFR